MSDWGLIEYAILIGSFWLTGLMFSYRIALRFGYKASRSFIEVQIALCVLLIYFHGAVVLGSKNVLIFMAVSSTVGILIELIGTRTEWMFGQYRYSKDFGPKLFKRVPVFVPLMWCVLTYMGFWTARLLLASQVSQSITRQGIFIISAAFIVTLWDIVADPMVVHEGGRNWWYWEKRGKFHGVPFTNFAGWFLTAALIYILLFVLADNLIPVSDLSPWIEHLPAFGYCVTMAVFGWACLDRRLIAPGIIGLLVAVFCFVMGLMNIIR
ncbi:carotenoid biosynthesis protein [Candidatus Poribacteria bacterium]